jgi:hypothetical protein
MRRVPRPQLTAHRCDLVYLSVCGSRQRVSADRRRQKAEPTHLGPGARTASTRADPPARCRADGSALGSVAAYPPITTPITPFMLSGISRDITRRREWDSVSALVRDGSASNRGSNAVRCRFGSYRAPWLGQSTGVLRGGRRARMAADSGDPASGLSLWAVLRALVLVRGNQPRSASQHGLRSRRARRTTAPVSGPTSACVEGPRCQPATLGAGGTGWQMRGHRLSSMVDGRGP